MTDKELAEEIKISVKNLNRIVNEAYNRGLRVDMDVHVSRTIDRIDFLRSISVDIYRKVE